MTWSGNGNGVGLEWRWSWELSWSLAITAWSLTLNAKCPMLAGGSRPVFSSIELSRVEPEAEREIGLGERENLHKMLHNKTTTK